MSHGSVAPRGSNVQFFDGSPSTLYAGSSCETLSSASDTITLHGHIDSTQLDDDDLDDDDDESINGCDDMNLDASNLPVNGAERSNTDQHNLNNSNGVVRDCALVGRPQLLPLHGRTGKASLVDVNSVFGPLFRSFGLETRGPVGGMIIRSLGRHISLIASLDVTQVEIIEADSVIENLTKLSQPAATSDATAFSRHPRRVHTAFLMDGSCLQANTETLASAPVSTSGVGLLPIAQTEERCVINLVLDVKSVMHNVNMPLLRLLNQVAVVHQNVCKNLSNRMGSGVVGTGGSGGIDGSGVGGSGAGEASSAAETSTVLSHDSMSEAELLSNQFSTRSSQDAVRPPGQVEQQSEVGSTADRLIIHTTTEPRQIAQQNVEAVQQFKSCWKIMYNLLDLYSSIPQANMDDVPAQISIAPHIPPPSPSKTLDTFPFDSLPRKDPADQRSAAHNHKGGVTRDVTFCLPEGHQNDGTGAISKPAATADIMPVIILNVIKVRKIGISAMISGLKFEAEAADLLLSLHLIVRQPQPLARSVDASRHSYETSIVGQASHANLALLEGANQETVAQCFVNNTRLMHTSRKLTHDAKNEYYATLCVEAVEVEIPQHPVTLHGIVIRGTKELSSTIQEFRSSTTSAHVGGDPGPTDVHLADAHLGRGGKFGPAAASTATTNDVVSGGGVEDGQSKAGGVGASLLNPLIMQFFLMLKRVTVSAALLPSLRAQYRVSNIVSRGTTGNKAKFSIDLTDHSPQLQHNVGID